MSLEQPPPSASKILTLEQVDAWVDGRKNLGHRIGFTCGSFDLLHAGHVQYLEEARSRCDALLVAVNSDASVRRYKSALRPLNPLAQRQFVLAGLSAVDVVTVLEDDRPASLLRRWKPAFYIKGGDYASSRLRSSAVVSEYGGETLTIPVQFSTSTSKLLERISSLQLYAEPEHSSPGPARIVFLDRDGTLIDDIAFLHDPARVRLKPGVIDGLKELRAAGFGLVIVTNQQGLGLGYFDMDQFIAVNQRLLQEIGSAGAAIDRIYFCPHSQADACDCRKPEPGMLLRACRDFNVDPALCVFLGDTAADRAAGNAAGVPVILIRQDVPDFHTAVERILNPCGDSPTVQLV